MSKKEADTGGEKKAGNYVVAYAVESAEGMYKFNNGELNGKTPEKRISILKSQYGMVRMIVLFPVWMYLSL